MRASHGEVKLTKRYFDSFNAFEEVSILLVNYNQAEMVNSCVRALEDTFRSDKHRVLIIDNASVDVDRLPQGNFITVIKSEANLGYAEGFNFGLKSVNTKYCIILTPDVIVLPHCLDHLLSTIRKNPNAAIVGGMLLKSETESIDSAGGILTYPFGVPYGIKADEPRDSVSSWSPFETAFVGGALMAVDRKKIIEIGGFDSDFFAYNEEVDLAWRARLAGYSIICVPSAMARHFSKSTWRKKLWARAFLIERNRIMTCVKNLSKMKLVVALMAEIVYATLIICGCLVYKEIEYLKSYLGALAWNFSNIRLLLMKRSLVQSRRKVPDSFVLTLHQHISLLGLLRMLLTIYRRLD